MKSTMTIINETTVKRSEKEMILKYYEIYSELKRVVDKALNQWDITEEKRTELIKALAEMEAEYQKVNQSRMIK
mgnify:CR=1 FL=1